MDGALPGRSVCTTCPYCGVGCGVVAEVAVDGAVSIRGDAGHPANRGRLCSKGSALAETIDLDGRLLHPQIDGKRTDWDTALDRIAATFAATAAEHGPDAVALYISGQLLTEDYYVANKLMKGFVGTANIDTNSRLCMASSVAGHKRAFGSDTVPGCYEDIERADLVVLTGSNLAWCHPVLFQRLAAARLERPSMKIVVIDPRRTATCEIADLHLALAPDSDVALFAGLLRHLAAAAVLDRAFIADHTDGFDGALKAADDFDFDRVAAATGLGRSDIATFFRWFATTEKSVTVYSQGVNQSVTGVDKVNAIVNCHLATGRIGRPGMGPFSVTGQPNAMGGREVGGLANQLAAHMEIADPAHRAIVGDFWGAPRLAGQPGLKAVELFDAVADGRVRALWIMATNPVDSLPDGHRVEQALRDCPFVVVSDVIAATDTARHADILLPSTAWGEKSGTVTNSERRISRQRAFLPAPGEARPDWWQLAEVGRRMGWADAFAWDGPAAIFAEHAALSAAGNNGSRDFDIGAMATLDAAAYDALTPFQWPAPRTGRAADDGARMFADGRFFTPSGRAAFVAVRPIAPRPLSAAFPLVLNTGRVRDHWHTLTRTAKSPRLSGHVAEPFAELHPADAHAAGIAPASLVRLTSERGEIVVRALIADRQARGSVFVPMHWTDQFAARGRVDTLVAPATDPISGQPGSKYTPVAIAPFAAAWYGFAVLADRPSDAALDGVAYWALARTGGGWRVELAGSAPDADWPGFADRLLGGAAGGDRLAYGDAATGIHRFAQFRDGALAGALFVARAPVAVSRRWAADQLCADMCAAADRFRLLAGRAGADQPDPGALVCSCFTVGVNQIVAAIADGGCTNVAAVGAALQAGTNCGSCRAEIQGIIDHVRTKEAV